MARERYSNAPSTTLNGAINSAVTSLIVTSGSAFPASQFRILIDSEIILCTSRSANTLTVLRGQEGTAAASHLDLAAVNHILTAGSLDELRLDMLDVVGLVPKTTSLSADDDEFDDESFNGWTEVATTPALTKTEQSHHMNFLIPTGTAAAQFYGYMKAKAPSAGNWVQAGFRFSSAAPSYPMAGVMIADGATYGAGKQTILRWSPVERTYALSGFTNYNNFANAAASQGGIEGHYAEAAIHLRLTWLGSNNYDGHVSLNGVHWLKLFSSVGVGTMTPTHMGFGVSSWGAGKEVGASLTYCRFNF